MGKCNGCGLMGERGGGFTSEEGGVGGFTSGGRGDKVSIIWRVHP